MNTNTKQPGFHKQDTHYNGRHSKNDSVQRFVPQKNKRGEPSVIRFENLRPGSYFTIFAEPSRKVYKSNDDRIYQKAYDMYNAHHVSSPLGIVLYPQDLVVIHKLVPLSHD